MYFIFKIRFSYIKFHDFNTLMNYQKLNFDNILQFTSVMPLRLLKFWMWFDWGSSNCIHSTIHRSINTSKHETMEWQTLLHVICTNSYKKLKRNVPLERCTGTSVNIYMYFDKYDWVYCFAITTPMSRHCSLPHISVETPRLYIKVPNGCHKWCQLNWLPFFLSFNRML